MGLLVLLGVAVSIWYAGDFHTLHYADDLIHSLNSLYRWTPLSWESDHIGSLLALLAIGIDRPYWNVLAISTMSSFLFLGGLSLWASLLSSRRTTLIESAVWMLLLLPVVVDKHRIFDNAAHGSTFGSAFCFAALFLWMLKGYLERGPAAGRLLALFVLGFLTVYLSKTVLIPVGVVTLCLLSEQLAHEDWPRSGRAALRLVAPAVCLAAALLAYDVLEFNAPVSSDFTPSLSNISISLPALLGNWMAQEIATPLLIAVPVGLCFYRSDNRLLGFLAAGVLVESLIISSSQWVIITRQSGYYLTDLTFLLVLTCALLAGHLFRRLTPPALHGRFLPILAMTALLLNTREWNSFSPALPFRAMDMSIGALTPPIVDAGCDLLLSGDTMEAWPAMLAANDFYFRDHLSDPRTGEMRMVVALTLRSSAIEHLWRPRLDWPDVTVCSFTGDESGVQQALQRYAPERTLFFAEPKRYGQITAYRLENRHLTEADLAFDAPLPGEGWSFPEKTPAGESFIWMNATTSTLYLPLATDRDLQLHFRILYAMSPDILDSLSLSVNGQALALEAVSSSSAPVVFRASLPRAALAANPEATLLTFSIDRVLSPALVMPPSDDKRFLGVAFDWLEVK